MGRRSDTISCGSFVPYGRRAQFSYKTVGLTAAVDHSPCQRCETNISDPLLAAFPWVERCVSAARGRHRVWCGEPLRLAVQRVTFTKGLRNVNCPYCDTEMLRRNSINEMSESTDTKLEQTPHLTAHLSFAVQQYRKIEPARTNTGRPGLYLIGQLNPSLCAQSL